jgi:UDP-N-acetylmuramoyl-tripeptide--D-alanyl-D-alanine ligase
MKLIFKTILKYYLKYITKLVLFIHRPTIIGIAGSTNKTFVKEEISRILKKQGIDVRANPKSFNTEIGLPLAILYLPSGYNSYRKWLPIIKKAFFGLWQKNYPKYLILELGVSIPGDIKYLLTIIKPKIAIITDITQRYLESFSGMDELTEEYEYLARKIPKHGLLLLNNDNQRISTMSKSAQANIIFFGLKDGADWQAIKIEKNKLGHKIIVKHQKSIDQYEIGKFGQHHVYALLIGSIIKYYVAQSKI